mmetsp:Transcript_82616/g.221514  ORF Transcript_82616/g.221514 Transcript_82616/m.221514 type:complete len:95 (+) Transcript_82616:133-417(+)
MQPGLSDSFSIPVTGEFLSGIAPSKFISCGCEISKNSVLLIVELCDIPTGSLVKALQLNDEEIEPRRRLLESNDEVRLLTECPTGLVGPSLSIS